eukprot:6104843-Pleurochrysis_carterae.AAC.1
MACVLVARAAQALDATHLAEFHQVEGFVIDRNLSLGNLMGTIADFYRRLGEDTAHSLPVIAATRT